MSIRSDFFFYDIRWTDYQIQTPYKLILIEKELTVEGVRCRIVAN